MTRRFPSRRTTPVTLILALLMAPGCKKQQPENTPSATAQTQPGSSSMTPIGGKLSAPHGGVYAAPKNTVPQRPPGAPTAGALLAFPPKPRTFFDWRESPPWVALVKTHFRLPRGHTRFAARIIAKGWTTAKSQGLAKHLEVFKSDIDQAAGLPPCAPLRKTWTHTNLLLTHRSLFTLKTLQEALLLRARQHQHQRRPAAARIAAAAALRLACHAAQIPEVVMQIMALKAESAALKILTELMVAPAECALIQRALSAHGSARASLDDIARADWLSARSHLYSITKDLAKAPSANAAAKRRLRKLRQLIVQRTSAAYRRYSLLLRQGLATNRPVDWKLLDGFLAKHDAAFETLKKKLGAKSSSELMDLVSKQPGKPAVWTADVLSKIFLALVTIRSSIWQRARKLHTLNAQTTARLRGRKCPTRPRPSATP